MTRDHATDSLPLAPVRQTVLIVEHDDLVRHRVRTTLRGPGREVVAASTVREALAILPQARPDLVFVGLEIPDAPGLPAVDLFHQRAPGAPVVVMTASPSVAGAVEALRRGAIDYVGHRDDAARLAEVTERALREARASKQLQKVKDQVRDQYGFHQLLTQSPRMIEVFDQIRAVASTDATVLILGETGTGKELVSRAIHDKSRRRDQAFIGVNCGAFTESLLESELFGHERGSFTGAVGRREGLFEMADGGSLFLDELGETTLNVQVNLLRVLEEMTFRRVGGRDQVRVDVRIIAATHVNLERAVAEKKFRQDLFYRLSVFPIRLPPLRQRREDIPLLMRHFLDELSAEYGLEAPVVAGEAMETILSYGWPGNVRELRAMCERWLITRAGQRLQREHLSLNTGAAPRSALADGSFPLDPSLTMRENTARVVEQLERAYLYQQLKAHGGHQGHAAEASGITRRTLYTKLKQYDLDPDDFKS